MSALAMSRPFSKTYSRTAQKADHASKAFDEAVLGTTGKPCPVKATSIIQKWGKASFTSTRGSPAAATAPSVTEKSRKRKIADDRNGGTSDDDPFSFDLEDVGPSKAKRGMGFKVPDKAKSGVEPTNETTEEEQRKDVETTNKKVLRDAGRRIEHMANSDFTESGSDGEVENGKKISSSPDAVRVVQKAADVFASQFGGTGDSCRGRNGKGAVKSQGRQLLMDDFAKKATNLINAKVTTTTNVNSSVSKTMLPSKTNATQSSKPAVKKFFVSRDRRNNNQPKTSPDALTSTSVSIVESKATEKSDDVWDSDSVNWDVDSGDPEIVFNSAKKVGGVEAVVDKRTVVNKRLVVNKQTVVSKQTVVNKQAVVDEQPVVEALRSLSYEAEWDDALDSSEEAVSPVKESELTTSLKAKPEAMLHSGATQKSKEKSKEKWKEKTKEAPVVKRLLTGLKKTQSRSKASYNHRQWHNSDEESQPGSGDSQTSVIEVKKTVKDEMAFESSDEEPIKSPAVMYRAVGKPPLGKPPLRCAAEAVAGIKVSKKHKPLFMVVRNVKRAHECQEYGETQEFTDDIDYIMDGLHDGQPVPTRCLSAINLVNKCASHAFRMHLRAHGILAKILSALHDAAKYPTLALCTSAIMYMMSSDRLTLELDGSSLELILQVLSSEVQTSAEEDSRTWKEYETIQQKIHSVFDGFHQNGKIQRTDMLSTDITAGNLAMEALLRLTSKRDGDWFKDELRTLGGLDHIIDTVCKAVASLDEAMLELTDTAVDSITKVDRCFRVLENVTYLKLENQNHLINYSSSALIRTVTSCLTFCETCLPFNELTTKGEKVKKDSPGYIIYSCLLASLRVLVNLTHDNEVGSAKVGQEDGLMKTLLTSILRLPRYLPTAERFDVLVLGLGLLVNLVEHSRNNLRVLLGTPTVAPFDQYPSINGEMNSLEALGMLFSLRFEAAKMIEEEHDAELEEKERQRQEMVSRCTMISTSNQASEAANKSGVWQESDSGIQWIAAISKDSRTRDSVSGVSDDASSIGDIQLMGGTSSSQGESENFTKALHKAGRHMEDSIVAAYVALVVGCVIQHNLDLAEKVRDTLPDCSFDPMIRMLRKFLGFMNLTSSSTANSSKSIVRVLEVLESC